MKLQALFLLLLFHLSFTAITYLNDKPKIPHNLLPIPSSYTYGSDTITISDPCNFSFNFMTKDTIPQVPQLIALYRKYMFGKSCKTLPTDPSTLTADPNSILNIQVDNIKTYLMNTDTSEAYSLHIQDGFLTLNASTYIGLVRGLETFSQLITTSTSRKSISYSIQSVPITITDSPRFPHRGLMLDTARHFISKQKIFEIMDAMLSVKINILHWHLTDSDSFPLEIPSRPSLNKYGAFSDSQIYTKADVQEIVNYAILRGIKIIPEVDTPSHTASWALVPEFAKLVFCADSVYDLDVPVGVLNPTRDETFALVSDILKDLQSYFPWDSLHIGGDEVNSYCWNNDEVNDFMKKNNIPDFNALFNYYMDKVKAFVQLSKTKIYWVNPDIRSLKFQPNEVLQWWGNTKALSTGINNYPNNKYILSNFDVLYLDCGTGNAFGGGSWCDPYHTWLDVYSFEPAKVLKKDQLDRVLGLEVVLWAEVIDDSVLMNKAFPRASAMAEKAWSQADNNYSSNYAVFVRLNGWRKMIAGRGINVHPISSGYCEKRPEMCFD